MLKLPWLRNTITRDHASSGSTVRFVESTTTSQRTVGRTPIMQILEKQDLIAEIEIGADDYVVGRNDDGLVEGA